MGGDLVVKRFGHVYQELVMYTEIKKFGYVGGKVRLMYLSRQNESRQSKLGPALAKITVSTFRHHLLCRGY